MIIGISGKIGSGKDTVGKIIQYLTYPEWQEAIDGDITNTRPVKGRAPYDIKDWLNEGMKISINNNSQYQIKKFAAKLKEVCSLLTGIPVEDFEKQEVKDTLLSVDWDTFSRPSISELRDTDNFLDSFDLAQRYGYNWEESTHKLPTEKRQEIKYQCLQKAFADGWKEYEGIDNARTYYWNSNLLIREQKTVRWLLQTVGTEAMRNSVHENVWVNALFADYKPIDSGLKNPYLESDFPLHQEWNIWFSKQMPSWIITDMRFPNELEAVKKHKGITIRVNRENFDRRCQDCYKQYKLRDKEKEPVPTRRFYQCPYCNSTNTKGLGLTSTHPSETSLDNATFKYTIDNNGTIKDLVKKVKEILIQEKIIHE